LPCAFPFFFAVRIYLQCIVVLICRDVFLCRAFFLFVVWYFLSCVFCDLPCDISLSCILVKQARHIFLCRVLTHGKTFTHGNTSFLIVSGWWWLVVTGNTVRSNNTPSVEKPVWQDNLICLSIPKCETYIYYHL
jgi:hypothetical protein